MDRCRCGGRYVKVSDGLTVEAGGAVASQNWVEFHCDRCGCEPYETCDKCKEVAVGA